MKALFLCGLLFFTIYILSAPLSISRAESDQAYQCSIWKLMERKDKTLVFLGYEAGISVAYAVVQLKDPKLAKYVSARMRPYYTTGNMLINYVDEFCRQYPSLEFTDGIVFFIGKHMPRKEGGLQ